MTYRRPVPALLACVALLALALLASPSASPTSAPSPQIGRSFVVGLVSGTVLVKPKGSARYTRLTGRRTIPVGSTVNATTGKVRLIGAVDGSGGTQSGVFYKGAFKATQAQSPEATIDLRLVGGNFAACGDGAGAGAAGRRRLGRRLWGIARGRFRTRGKHSAATVRGTKWLTQDRCASTGVEAVRGRVEATSGDRTLPLAAGEALETVCVPNDDPQQRQYCLYVQNLVAFERNVAFIALSTKVHQGDYTLCVRPPTGDPICSVFPIPERDPTSGDDARRAVALCYPDRGKGTYTTSWTVQGQVLGILPFKVRRAWGSGGGRCPTTEGVNVPGSP